MNHSFLIAAFALCGVLRAAAPPPDETAFFESKVRPLLVERCYECHSHGKKIKGGLALDSRSGWERGGDNGPAIRPRDVEGSLLIKAIRYADRDLEMPPKAKLPASEIAILEQWVKRGAPDPRATGEAAAARFIDIEAGRKHWAFQPVADPALPQVKDAGWVFDSVDRFIFAGLEAARLRPAADADRHTWLRRVSLDLTGLPPTPAEVEAFIGDRSAEAFAKVVDRLLGSRAFGERWARHWLDLTGYADQVGTSNSVFAEHAWRYRDYLIDSFNADKPFDRFVREQIAGDLLPHQSPAERTASIIATGFLVLGDVEIVNPDKLKMETDLVDQQLSKVGTAFLGMTLGCARCHDHKFDPVALDDYYAMAGIFQSTVSTRKIPNGIWSGITVTNLPETRAQTREREARDAAHREKLERLKAERARLEAEKTRVASELAKAGANKQSLRKQRDEIAERLKKLPAEIEHAEFFATSVPKAFAVHDAEKPGDMRINIRGNPYATGPLVPRAMLRVASWGTAHGIPPCQSGRLQLADWLVDRRNPLTARVTVNRIWQKLFGEGLVRSVDYFGTRGEKPTHPELLDHLATRFMQDGWSQKQLIRALVLSHAYRMRSASDPRSAAKDPENRLLWRMNRQRLDAEALRDAMLLASGELQPASGGPALPLEYVENTTSLKPQAVNPPAFALRKFRPEQEFVRTIYLPVIRSAQPGPARLRDVFDFTQPAQMAGRRAQTVVPTQALFLLNDDLLRKRAAALAKSVTATASNRPARLDALWLRTLNRPITSAEREDANAFLERLAPVPAESPAGEDGAWIELAHALLSSNEFLHRL
jgi:hypothetical protein